jgi:hypothetical protein
MWNRNGNTWYYGSNANINVRPVRYKDGRVLWTGYWKDERVPHILPDGNSDIVMRRAERYFDSRIEIDGAPETMLTAYVPHPTVPRLPVIQKLGVMVAEG